MARKKEPGILAQHERIALVLQGGGALGAYQAGVYEELCRAGYQPKWIAGVSIGAINCGPSAASPLPSSTSSSNPPSSTCSATP